MLCSIYSKFKIKYFPPGSKQDRDHGIDLEINGKSFQIKELTGMSEEDGKLILNTPLPKNYLGMKVEAIMLVDIKTGEYISFPNKNYEIDVKNKCFILDNNKVTILLDKSSGKNLRNPRNQSATQP